ncbi:RPS3A [Symbiodinium sp. CCMP2592]|nr:RPS3A [Symbiodinium sp. CCMP2592]
MPLPAFAEKPAQEAEGHILNAVLPAPSVVAARSFRERPECMDFPASAQLEAEAIHRPHHPSASVAEELLPLPLPSVSGLYCPLCHKTFEDPVMTIDGHTFCRRCIQDWFMQHASKSGAAPLPNSPVSGQPLLSKLLMPNLAIGKVLTSIRENVRPAWVQVEQEREALRFELQQRSAELLQVKTSTEGQSKELNDAELKTATLTVKLQMTEEEARAARGEIERLNEEICGLREKLERFQAALAGERSSVQQIEDMLVCAGQKSGQELDSHLRFASAEVQRLQSELETVKKQERALQKGKAKESAELGKVLQEKQKMQDIIRVESLPASVVLAEELEYARRDAEAKELQIQDLQLVGTRMGSQLIVPQMESENQQLRNDLSTTPLRTLFCGGNVRMSDIGKVSELDEVNERLSKLEEAAPELTAAELLATEAERLEEELNFSGLKSLRATASHENMSASQVSKKRKFVADGVFNAELNEFLARTLGEDGYAGVEVRVTPIRTEIIIRATRTREVLGEKGRRIRELTALVQKRFGFPENSVELFAERVENRASCAMAQCESLRFKLIGGLAVRRACYGVLRFIMENGAKGVEVIISGKLRAQRAKAMKFRQGYLISTGEPKRHYISEAVRHVQMRQGTIGIKVKIMMSHDPEGKMGPKMQLPDNVIVHEPKDETPMMMPPQDLLRGIPLVLADFLVRGPLVSSHSVGSQDLTNAGALPEDAPRLVIAALQKLQTAVSKREEELKAANEKIAELCKYGAKRDEDVQREAYDALRVELLDVSKRCADAEAKLRELGVEETKGAGTSLITKMSMLIYQLQVSVISGTGLRTKGWRPGPESEALSCIVEVVGKEAKFETKPVRDSKNPAWNHTGELQMSHSDSLRFMVQGTKQRALGKADLQATRLIGQGSTKRSDRKRQAFCQDTLCNSFCGGQFARKRLQSLRPTRTGPQPPSTRRNSM